MVHRPVGSVDKLQWVEMGVSDSLEVGQYKALLLAPFLISVCQYFALVYLVCALLFLSAFTKKV